MSITLRIALIIFVLIYLAAVIFLLKKKRLTLKYSLLWLALGIVMAVLVIWPQLLKFVADLAGFEDSMNALFACTIAFCYILLMALTSIVSKQSNKIKQLIQEQALLEKRIRELEEKDE